MATGPTYRVMFRRRREGRTNFHRRRKLILSRVPRFVPRGSLRNMSVQIVESKPIGDYVLASANSKELRKFGWLGSCGNTPSAYLVGFLAGSRAKSSGLKQAILDVGLLTPSKGTRILASLKGALDAGLEIAHDEKVLPDADRISGKHIANYGASLGQNTPDLYSRFFSRDLANRWPPEQIPNGFEKVKKEIQRNLAGETNVPI